MLFTSFTDTFEKFKRMVSTDSKHSELKEFYKLLSNLKNHKSITTETKNCKNRTLKNHKSMTTLDFFYKQLRILSRTRAA